MNQPLKVLVIVRWPVGGIRTFLKYVFGALDEGRIALTLVVPKVESLNALKEDLRHLDVRWVELDESPRVTQIMGAVRKLLAEEPFDLVHAHGFTAAAAAALPVRLGGVHSIATFHEVLLPQQFPGWKGRLKKWALALALNQYDCIHLVSDDAAENLSATLPFIDRDKCVTIKSGIDTRPFVDAEALDLRAELGLATDTRILGFFGRFMAPKGFRFLIDAVDLLRQRGYRNLHVACFGSGGFIREDRALVQQRGLAEHFHFRPFVPGIASYIKGCDLVVMPSLWEACGLLAMETLAAGTPLVAASCIGLREVCRDTPAVMVRPADAASLADGILSCLATPRAAFRSFVPIAEKRFDAARMRNQILELYDGLAGKYQLLEGKCR